MPDMETCILPAKRLRGQLPRSANPFEGAAALGVNPLHSLCPMKTTKPLGVALAVAVTVLCAVSGATEDNAATLIFVNAQVVTMVGPDDVHEAIALAGDRILAVGTSAEMRELAGDATEIVDLDGRAVLPAFIDPHTHVFSGQSWENQILSAAEIQDHFLALGITTVADFHVTPDVLEFARSFAAEGRARLRTHLYLTHTDGCGNVLGTWYEQHAAGTELGPNVTVTGVKFFAGRSNCGDEGGKPVFSEWVEATMSDAWKPFFAGNELVLPPADLTAAVQRAHNAGYSVAIHAVGDVSVETAFEAITDVLAGRPNDLRHKIAHNYYTPDLVIDRATPDGPIFLIEPLLLCGVEEQNEGIGPRGAAMYKRYPEMLASGACVALDSDWPLIPADPLLKLYSVVTAEEIRPRFEGESCNASVLSAHTVSVWDGLRMLTINGAWAMNLDRELGTLEPGKVADLVVLSANPLHVDPYEIPDIEVLQTFKEGARVYGGS